MQISLPNICAPLFVDSSVAKHRVLTEVPSHLAQEVWPSGDMGLKGFLPE
jgi:hypothetical protein